MYRLTACAKVTFDTVSPVSRCNKRPADPKAEGEVPEVGVVPVAAGGAEAARTRTGAGLGLAISRAIVEAHGGRIWLVDAPGGGTRVRFSLPAAAMPAR